jgi:hypothetical protein
LHTQAHAAAIKSGEHLVLSPGKQLLRGKHDSCITGGITSTATCQQLQLEAAAGPVQAIARHQHALMNKMRIRQSTGNAVQAHSTQQIDNKDF